MDQGNNKKLADEAYELDTDLQSYKPQRLHVMLVFSAYISL